MSTELIVTGKRLEGHPKKKVLARAGYRPLKFEAHINRRELRELPRVYQLAIQPALWLGGKIRQACGSCVVVSIITVIYLLFYFTTPFGCLRMLLPVYHEYDDNNTSSTNNNSNKKKASVYSRSAHIKESTTACNHSPS